MYKCYTKHAHGLVPHPINPPCLGTCYLFLDLTIKEKPTSMKIHFSCLLYK